MAPVYCLDAPSAGDLDALLDQRPGPRNCAPQPARAASAAQVAAAADADFWRSFASRA